MTARLPQQGPVPTHEVRVVDGRFASATCSCGWQGPARRSRATVRAEARDHALLYAAELRFVTAPGLPADTVHRADA